MQLNNHAMRLNGRDYQRLTLLSDRLHRTWRDLRLVIETLGEHPRPDLHERPVTETIADLERTAVLLGDVASEVSKFYRH